MIIRLLSYFGFGALAHWLWIGSLVDPTDIFTYVCLLLGPIMCFVWVFAKAFWVGILIALVAAMVVALVLTMQWVQKQRRRSRFPGVRNQMGPR